MGVFDGLNKENHDLINMYTTARQFKNAIDSNEKIMFKKDGFINKIFPYIVNKSFSCEVYLKMIIKNNGDSYDKVHSIIDLLELSKIRTEFENYIITGADANGIVYEKKQLNEGLESISNAFVNWRYIYEKKDIQVAEGLLNMLCNYLDDYCKRIIFNNTGIDMDKYKYI